MLGEIENGDRLRVTVRGGDLELELSHLDADAATVSSQVREDDHGERRAFDLAVTYPDTFTGQVMYAMARIPYGETWTYGYIAAALDTAPVTVGGACGRNPSPLVVPCHPIIASNGDWAATPRRAASP